MRLERLPKFAFSEVRRDDELSSLTFGNFFSFPRRLCWFPNILSALAAERNSLSVVGGAKEPLGLSRLYLVSSIKVGR
jgi:hypothetical protein